MMLFCFRFPFWTPPVYYCSVPWNSFPGSFVPIEKLLPRYDGVYTDMFSLILLFARDFLLWAKRLLIFLFTHDFSFWTKPPSFSYFHTFFRFHQGLPLTVWTKKTELHESLHILFPDKNLFWATSIILFGEKIPFSPKPPINCLEKKSAFYQSICFFS